jgi:hypothetical protein
MKKIRNGLCHCPPFSLPLENSCRAGNTGVASPDSLKSGKVDMKDYVLKEKPEPASNEMVWAFDLGNVPRPSDGRGWRAATGEGCHWPDEVNENLHHEFLHKGSLLCRAVAQRWLVIPAEFAETKTAAGRRRKT